MINMVKEQQEKAAKELAAINLSIWNKVAATSPSKTKRVNQRGGFTAIDPTYQAMKATERFGPYGIGWGLSKTEFDYTLIEQGLVIHKAVFFYLIDGKKGDFPITNAIKIFADKEKTRIDEDFAKKVETNTISKSLSRLGFSADVFMGLFDDGEYLATAKQKEYVETSINQQEAFEEVNKEFGEWARREIDAYSRVPEAGLGVAHRANIRKLNLKLTTVKGTDPAKWHARFEDAYTTAKSKFTVDGE